MVEYAYLKLWKMVNPGAFKGMRKEFLKGQKPAYADAVIGNYVSDFVADICRRYFKRFPIDLDHNIDPSPEWLAQVDDNKADPELLPQPNEDDMDPEEYKNALREWSTRRSAITFRRMQIRRWMAYQHTKDHGVGKKTLDLDDPMTILLAKLTGSSISKPRQPIPYNLWAKENRIAIEAEYNRERRRLNSNKNNLIKLRAGVTRKLFDALPEDVRDEWQSKAKLEHVQAVKAWEERLTSPALTDPKSRQECIEGLVHFMQPILDLACEHTGLKASLMMGGPEPADGGRLNVISIHSGTTTGSINATFGASDRAFYKQTIVPAFGAFLKKCYTMEECRSRALSSETTLLGQITAEASESVMLDSADWESGVQQGPLELVGPSAVSQSPIPTTLPPVAPPSDSGPQHPPTPHGTSTPPRLPSPALGALSPGHVLTPVSPCASPPPSPVPSLISTPSRRFQPSVLVSPHAKSSSAAPAVSPGPGQVPKPAQGSKRKRISEDGKAIDPNDNKAKRQRQNPKKSASAKKAVSAGAREAAAQGKVQKKGRKSVKGGSVAAQGEDGATPPWVESACEMLRSEPMSPAWLEVVNLWEKFEAAHGFSGKDRIVATHRPTCISDWIQRARSPSFYPHIDDIEKFEDSFREWWNVLQPEWRRQSDGQLSRRVGDWAAIRKPGPNGLLSVLAALFFWGIQRNELKTPLWAVSTAWADTLEDVTWVFSELLKERGQPASL